MCNNIINNNNINEIILMYVMWNNDNINDNINDNDNNIINININEILILM